MIEDLVAAGVAGIMVWAVDPKNRPTGSTSRLAGRCCSPRLRCAQSKRVAYIGSSNTDLGKEAGKLDAQGDAKRRQVLGFVGLPGADNARERIEGVKGSQGPKVELIDVRGDEIDQTRAKRNVEDALVAQPDVTCMVGFYSYNTPRIYEVAEEAGKLG